MAAGTATTPGALRHEPALDGIRALAVGAVMLFHGGWGRTPGGFLGVDMFLVLSGFLITYLLLREIAASGRVDVGSFWLRRARRLLPALFLLLLAVAVYGRFVASHDEALDLRGDIFGSLLYVQNWRLVISGQPYFAQFGSPSPLRHMWSLSIEEQWYLIWPLVLLGIVRVTGRRPRRIAAVILALSALSAVSMAALSSGADGSTRIYYGTDTRAQALLIGATLAVIFAFTSTSTRSRRSVAMLVQLGGFAGLGFLVWAITTRDEHWTRLPHGGFTAVAVAAALLIAAAMQPGPIRRVLSIQPLPAIGLISYGLYLWHWPVDLVLSPDRTGLDGAALFVVRTAIAFGIATASFALVERPIREQRFSWTRSFRWVPAAAAATAAVLVGLTASGAAAQPRPHVLTPGELEQLVTAKPGPDWLRTLVVGDSIAFTLIQSPVPARLHPPIWLRGAARIGCGLLAGVPYSDGRRGESQSRCAGQANGYRAAVRRYDPQLALVLVGGWEIYDRRVGGRTLRFGTPAMEAALDRQLERTRAALTARGAVFGLMTTPCFDATRRDLGQWGESERADPSRTRWLNQVWMRYVQAHPGTVLVDLDSLTCPNGQYRAEADGVRLRSDGVHFTAEGADALWPALGVLIERAYASATPTTTPGS